MKIYYMNENLEVKAHLDMPPESRNCFLEQQLVFHSILPQKKDYIELNGRGFKVTRRVFFPLDNAVEIWCEENAA